MSATSKFETAVALKPPVDTLLYLWVPPGDFMMGTTPEQFSTIFNQEKDRKSVDYVDELPAHPVHVDGFWIMRTEVTNGQYTACIEDRACEPPNNTGCLNSGSLREAQSSGSTGMRPKPTWNGWEVACLPKQSGSGLAVVPTAGSIHGEMRRQHPLYSITQRVT